MMMTILLQRSVGSARTKLPKYESVSVVSMVDCIGGTEPSQLGIQTSRLNDTNRELENLFDYRLVD